MAGNDVFLRTIPSDADQDDIRLYDPNGVAGGDATANGTTFGHTFSFFAGSASGGGAMDATANGVTFSYGLSLLSGSASASSQASGVVLSHSYSLLSGSAQASSQANGIVLPYAFSLLAGSASGQANATANGATLAYNYLFIGGAATGGQLASRGDDASFKRPIVNFRPKRERQLDKVLEHIETAQAAKLTGTRRRAVKEAVQAISAVQSAPDYAPALQAISARLVAASKASAIHEGIQAAMDTAAAELETLLAAMETKRLKRRREEEILVSWLLQ